jgi:hypothetical protein
MNKVYKIKKKYQRVIPKKLLPELKPFLQPSEYYINDLLNFCEQSILKNKKHGNRKESKEQY